MPYLLLLLLLQVRAVLLSVARATTTDAVLLMLLFVYVLPSIYSSRKFECLCRRVCRMDGGGGGRLSPDAATKLNKLRSGGVFFACGAFENILCHVRWLTRSTCSKVFSAEGVYVLGRKPVLFLREPLTLLFHFNCR